MWTNALPGVRLKNLILYGAAGYTGQLIAREAARRGWRPTLAGRNAGRIQPLADALGLPWRAFDLRDPATVAAALDGMRLVLHCAGPFSATSAPMIEACLRAGAHYLDITGEIAVFEHAQRQHARARQAGIVLCPGVGFDVIPTDCIALALKTALPDAVRLHLGFDSRSGLSPGTAKTSVEALAQGGKVRRNGQIVSVPLAWKTRQIDFGGGTKLAMTIPWGDVATAGFSTGIPYIEVYVPASPRMVRALRVASRLRWLLGLPSIQSLLKRRIDKSVKGPDEAARDAAATHVWGEAVNARGETRTARIRTANGYSLTVTGALAMTERVLEGGVAGGYYTPSLLAGQDLVARLPGSGPLVIA